jgi:RecA-family ATPase
MPTIETNEWIKDHAPDGDVISVMPTFKQRRGDKPISWIHPGMLRPGAVAMFVGHPGSGKSTFILKWLDAIANGKMFLGHQLTARPILYLDRDVNTEDDILERMEWLKLEDGGNFKYFGSNLPEVDVPMPGDPMIEKWVNKLVANGVDVRPIIVCDSFSLFLNGGDENSSKDVNALWTNIRKLKRYGVTFIFIHHLGKGKDVLDFFRGSTAIRAGVDFGFKVENTTPGLNNHDKDLTQMKLTRVKHRNSAKFGNQDSEMTIKISKSGDFQPVIEFAKPRTGPVGRPNLKDDQEEFNIPDPSDQAELSVGLAQAEEEYEESL